MWMSDLVTATRRLCGPMLVVIARGATIGDSLIDCAITTGIVTVVSATVLLSLAVVTEIIGATEVVVV